MTKTNATPDQIIDRALAMLDIDANARDLAELLRAFDNDMIRLIDAYYHDLRDDEPDCDCLDACDCPNTYDLIRTLDDDHSELLMRRSIAALTTQLTNAILS